MAGKGPRHRPDEAKQTIIVKRGASVKSLEDATALARLYADRIYTHRKTGSSFRFRQRPPTDFDQETFITEKKSPVVSIVWGILK